MIKILYLVSNFRRTGPTRQLLNIVSNLDRSVCEISVLSLSPEPEDSMIGDFRSLQINISSLALSRFKGFFYADNKVRSHILTAQADIIHSQGIRPDMIASKIQDRHVVSTIRNDPRVDYPLKFGKFIGSQMAGKHLKVMRKLKHPVACSQSLAEDLKSKYGISAACIQNGVDTEKYSPAGKAEKAKLREKLGLEKAGKYFLTAGSLIPRKNIEILIRAFLKYSGGNLLVLGDGPEKEKLTALCKDRQNIHLAGNAGNADEYMKAADFYLSASTGEGLPNTVLEAISSGLPVVVSDIAPHREIFAKTDHQYFFPPGDEKALIHLIGEINKDDHAALQKKMRSTAEGNFNAKFMAAKYQDLYFKLLS